jgi:hypothetical protein
MDDLGSAAWADTSPSASPKLDSDDIWGSAKVSGSRIPDLSPGGFDDTDFGQLRLDSEQDKKVEDKEEDVNEPVMPEKEDPEEDGDGQKGEQDVVETEQQKGSGSLDADEGRIMADASAHSAAEAVDDGIDDEDDFDFDTPAAPAAGSDEFGDFDDFGDFDQGHPADAAVFEGGGEQSEFVSEPQEMEDQVWEDPNRPAPPVSTAPLYLAQLDNLS